MLALSYLIAKKILKILNDKCDPKRYLTEYDSFYLIKKSDINRRPGNILNRYAALVNLGKYDEAHLAIESIPTPEKVKGKQYALLYYINAAHQDIFDGKFEEAREKLDIAMNIEMPEKYRDIYLTAIKRNEATILRKQGYLTESRKLYNELLQREPNRMNIVNYIFALGLIDVKEQKYDDAKSAFEKVIAEGNKLYTVTLAKQELEKLLNGLYYR